MPAIDTQHGKKAPPRSKSRTRKPTAAEIVQAAARQRRDAIQHTIETKADQATTRRQSQAAERGYRSQGRAVRLAASPHARRADTRARQLREIRARSRAQEAAYRSQGEHVELSATLQKLAREGLASAAKGTTLGARAFGVKVGRDRPGRELVLARTPKSFGRQGGREFSLIGKTPSELAEIVDAVTEKRWNGTLRVRQPDAALKGLRRLGQKRLQRRTAEVSAPARLLLDVAQRPVNLTAGAASAALKGKSVGDVAKGGWQGLTSGDKRKRKLFSDVLAEHGVSGPAKSILGFALDVGLDPTTYISLGATSVARQAAVKSAKEAAVVAEKAALESAATRGAITKQARQIAKQRGRAAGAAKLKEATKKAELQAPAHHLARGVDVRFAGKRIPGVTRASARGRNAVSRGAKSVGERNIPIKRTDEGEKIAIGEKAVQGGRALKNLGAEANANVRRAGQTRAQQAGVKALQREARADEELLINQVSRRLGANLGRLRKSERQRVMDAIENQRIGDLKGTASKRLRVRRIRGSRDPDRLFIVAKRVDADLRYLHRMGRRSGTITSKVGRGSRTRDQVALAGHRPTPRSDAALANVGQEIKAAATDLAKAKSELRAATKPSERIAARRRANHARQRYDNLRAKQSAMVTQKRASAAVASEHKASERERFGYTPREKPKAKAERKARGERRPDVLGAEARGYFPRLTKEQVKRRTLVEHLAQPLHKDVNISIESGGANEPKISSAQLRKHRETRAQIAANPEKADIARDLSTDVLKTVKVYAGSVARANAARNLNQKLIERFGEKPGQGSFVRNMSEQQHRELQRQGKAVYRVKGGTLQELADARMARAVSKRTKGGAGGVGGGQVAVLDRDLVAQVRGNLPGKGGRGIRVVDPLIRGFKTVALTTPTYLVRNLFGDTYNALGEEQFWRLMRNHARGQKVLGATARKEGRQAVFKLDPEKIGQTRAALRWFRDKLPPSRHWVKLTEEQAQQIAEVLGTAPGSVARRVPAEAVGLLAERMGVIRQGRLVELASGQVPRVKSFTGFQRAARRVEDSTRLATFLGGLHRGLSPQEAAHRVQRLHFDYGDLTRVEREGFRRIAPFYTFTARNAPLQAKLAVTRPGRVPHIAAAIEEGRRATGLNEDYAEGQNPYEQRQFGIPIRWGTNADGTPKIFTVSLGLPFTDLNDITALGASVVKGIKGDPVGGGVDAVDTVLQRIGEMANPLKVAGELKTNHSFFYRDEISPETEPYTRAPQWAVKAAKANPYAAKKLGVVFNYQPSDRRPGEPETGVPGWPRKIDYAMRNAQPGAIAPILDLLKLGVKGKNARQMGRAQRALAFFGVRAVEYETNQAKAIRLFDLQRRVQIEMNQLRRRSGRNPALRAGARNPTKRFNELRLQDAQIQRELHKLNIVLRPGGLVEGRRVPKVNVAGGGVLTGEDAAAAQARERELKSLYGG